MEEGGALAQHVRVPSLPSHVRTRGVQGEIIMSSELDDLSGRPRLRVCASFSAVLPALAGIPRGARVRRPHHSHQHMNL